MMDAVHGWDDPRWVQVAQQYLRAARLLAPESKRNPAPQKIVKLAAKHGPADEADVSKERRIANEAHRSLGLWVHNQTKHADGLGSALIDAAVKSVSRPSRVWSRIRATFESRVCDFDRLLESEPEHDPSAWAQETVEGLLADELPVRTFQASAYALVNAGHHSRDHRRELRRWIRVLKVVPDQEPGDWLVLAAEKLSRPTIESDVLRSQLFEMLEIAMGMVVPTRFAHGDLADRVEDRLITVMRWRDRLSKGQIDGSLEAYVKRVQRSCIIDSYRDWQRIRPTTDTDIDIPEGHSGPEAAAIAALEWLRFLAALQSDTRRAATLLAHRKAKVDDVNGPSRPRALAVFETTTQIIGFRHVEIDAALDGDCEAAEGMTKFLGGLLTSGPNTETPASWLRDDILRAFTDRHPSWRDRYDETGPDSRGSDDGAFDASEAADYRRELRVRSGATAAKDPLSGHGGVAAFLSSLYSETHDQLEAAEMAR